MYFLDLKKCYFHTVSNGQQTQWESALLNQWANRLPCQLLHSAYDVLTDLAENGHQPERSHLHSF